MSLQMYYITKEHKTPGNQTETEWLGTMPSHASSFNLIASVYGVKRSERLPWGNGVDDGYLSRGDTYRIKRV